MHLSPAHSQQPLRGVAMQRAGWVPSGGRQPPNPSCDPARHASATAGQGLPALIPCRDPQAGGGQDLSTREAEAPPLLTQHCT